MAEQTNDAASTGALAIAGQYLTFELGEEVYGIEILKIQEIIGMMDITAVPKTPQYVRGVINLRGKVIPVIDLRLKFLMEGREDTSRTCIIVVQVTGEVKEVTTGILVDEVSEVLHVAAQQIEPAPSFGEGVHTEFILGMGKVADKVIMLLDVDKVLTGEELSLLDSVD